MPEFGLGYWQCKLRYRTQEELLAVAREHKRRGLPMDAIVVDFFHWTRQGDFKFEPRDWPDPQAMVRELKSLGIETVVSVWPTIDERSENFGEMADKGMLVSADRGSGLHMTWMGNTVFYDATNPEARRFVWDKCRETITARVYAASGWTSWSRSTVRTTSTITVITPEPRSSARISTR